MNISVMENGTKMRQAFIEKFTMPWDEFQINNKEWIDALAAKNYTATYKERYLWELMDHRAISFATALALLRSLSGDVYIMSEIESTPGSHDFEIGGIKHKEIVAKINAKELSNLIEYEWYEPYRLDALGMYLAHTVLPEDLYVFDESMEHLLVFTHETDYWELELEQPMKCAASRFCMMHGFELPEKVPYQEIRTIITEKLNIGSAIEISYSYSKYYRQLVIFKRQTESLTGYVYCFDYPNTEYITWEEAENAKVFYDLSLKEISKLNDVRFDIIAINDHTP